MAALLYRDSCDYWPRQSALVLIPMSRRIAAAATDRREAGQRRRGGLRGSVPFDLTTCLTLVARGQEPGDVLEGCSRNGIGSRLLCLVRFFVAERHGRRMALRTSTATTEYPVDV